MRKHNKILEQISSMRTGLILLAVTVVFLVAGTLFVPEHYAESLLFQILLGLLFLNMAFCTINQLVLFLKSLGRKKGRALLRSFALLILHGGVVLSLIGGVWGGFFGFKEKFALFEGDSLDISLQSRGRLPVTLLLDDFEITYHEDGTESQFTTSFRLANGGGEVTSGTAAVNSPFVHNGIKLYFAQYMPGLQVDVVIDGVAKEGRMLGEGEEVPLPGIDQSVTIRRYYPDYVPGRSGEAQSRVPGNQAVVYEAAKGGGEPELMVAPLGEWVKLSNDSYLRFTKMRPYVVFMLKWDPGLGLAAAGGVLLMLGTCLLLIKRRNGDGKRNTPCGARGGAVIHGGRDLLPDSEKKEGM